MSSDQIAYLRDLANSYFQEGNLSAAVSAWEQVLALDPSNIEARQGLTLAQMKMQGQGMPAESGGHDPDATMMFTAGEVPGFGLPAAPPPAQGGGFDAERTMIFGGAGAAPPPAQGGGFDAERTMMFQPAAPAAPPPAGGGGFDAERTMMFQPSAPAAPLPTPGAGFDADRTMAFNPSLAPPPAAPSAPAAPAWQPPAVPAAPAAPAAPAWPSGPAAVPDADSTMMSPPSGGLDFNLPPMAPPSPFSPPGFGGPPGSKPLEDFSLPAPPSLGTGLGATPPPSGGGFSFELPPPPSAGGGPGLPDLPSVGFSSPPPTFTPSPPPPPPSGAPKKAGGQFGEVDPGEIESLAVPTVGPSATPPGDEASRKEREERLKREYETQYGKTPQPGSQPLPPRPVGSKPAVSPKFLIGLVVVLAVVLGGGYFGISWWMSTRESEYVPPTPEKDPNAGLSKDAAESLMSQKLAEADKAQRAGNLSEAERFIAEARDIALKNNLSVPQRVIDAGSELEREKQFQDAFQLAVKRFCVEDYPKAHLALLDLERIRPDKPEAGQFIERIFWNLAVEKLQQLEPWEAVYYLDNLAQRNPRDTEAAELLRYAQQFGPGAELGDSYLQKVDPLSTRMAGCQ